MVVMPKARYVTWEEYTALSPKEQAHVTVVTFTGQAWESVQESVIDTRPEAEGPDDESRRDNANQ